MSLFIMSKSLCHDSIAERKTILKRHCEQTPNDFYQLTTSVFFQPTLSD